MTREIIIEPGATTGKQYDFEYDLYGNILSKTESTYTVATGAITGSDTALFGDKISADKVNYMVVPTGHPEYSSLLGCVGVVRNNDTGEFVYAVVCEGGPSESSDWYGESAWDEVSIKVAWELNGHPYGSHIANERQYGNFSYFIFKKSKRDWNPSNDIQEEIDIIASKYWRLK